VPWEISPTISVTRTLGQKFSVAFVVLPIAAALVKIIQIYQSPGPLFYKQKRQTRHHRPGQVRKFRGQVTKPADIEARLKSDLVDVENWSLSLDCSIILRTF
jgi:lipopolysaccharide/colanic/teichoic acid biosynthesis glycosyltransferase